ncbi:WSCD family member AGAP003962-like isoform X2 [Watersipora subatra]|uniref:WSCD family member AGAP003962-like isoform X2 n=1 Tax=Watersipora subatra TaxID=2589382 RepID=UPI00355C3C99
MFSQASIYWQFLPTACLALTVFVYAVTRRKARWRALIRRRRESLIKLIKAIIYATFLLLFTVFILLTARFIINDFSCSIILSSFSNFTHSNGGMQLIAATPGSGSDYCRIALGIMTGFVTGSVYEVMNLTSFNQLPYRPFYYKSHYPFIASVSRVDNFINMNPHRVVVLVRNPFDAAFSEFIRQKVSLVNKDIDNKYNNMDQVIREKDFLVYGSKMVLQPTEELELHMKTYFIMWKSFHEYWLRNYHGSVKVILYQDLVDDILKFKEITNYFGYSVDSTRQRQQRLSCFLTNTQKTKYRKRPSSIIIDETKRRLREHFESDTASAIAYVQLLYSNKYNEPLHIS